MDVSIPPELMEAVRQLAEASGGAGARGLAADAKRLSEQYRGARPSREAVKDSGDVIAYVLSRMPATYAAVATVLAELKALAPAFAPGTLLDAGAGPGTAAWAVAEAFPELGHMTMADTNQQFLAAARTVVSAAQHAGLREAVVVAADMTRLDLAGRVFDMVTVAYALTELSDAEVAQATGRLWAHCTGVLVIVEPGRPRDYQRLLAVRERLIGLGARMLAPCPHEQACPLVAPDWCHFAVRLPRTRDHMRMKGATLGFEDEKFSYLVVAREGIGTTAAGRVIKPAAENKFSVRLEVCAADGVVEQRIIASRDRPAFKAAKKLSWGDAV